MITSRSLLVGLAVGVAAWMSAGCGNDVSISAAAPTPAAIETTPAPASTNDVAADAVDTSVDDDVAADTAPTVAPVPSRGQQAVPGRNGESGPAGQATSYASIRDVDFMNGFMYDTDFEFRSPLVTVADGSYENAEFGDPDYFWFGVTDVDFGDLTGDGADEAIVATSWNGGGTGYFDSVRAFRLVDGQVESAGLVLFGDRADGGIFDVRIADGTTYVLSFSTTQGACCPNQISQDTLVLGEHWLTRADLGPVRTFMSLNGSDAVPELMFIPATSSAIVAVYGYETTGTFTFEAARNQRLTFALLDGPAPADISVTALATGQVMSGLAEMVLPVDGFYQVSVTFDAERETTTTIDVIIDGGEPEPLVRWTPAVEQVVVTNEPYVTSSLIWPIFDSAQPGTQAANQELERFVAQLDDYWIEDVTEFSEPQDGSNYEVTYEVTLAAADLVSVRFDFYDYVCCRPYPNYGPRSAVLDLAAGRLIPVSEILDLNRLDEINRIWIAELEKQGMLANMVDADLNQAPMFDSLTLGPDGVEFGTERNRLGGGLPDTRTVVTYAQLGDLVNPTLVARATG